MAPGDQPHYAGRTNKLGAARNKGPPSLALIAVMGVTGSGKSNFLRHLTGNHEIGGPIVGHGLDSCTRKTTRYECRLENRQVVFFDTPGFDDTYRGDADILADVAQVLSSSYKNNLKLNGIIYLHRIKDERMTNAIMRNLTMFRNLCGNAAFQNVVLATTFWDELQDQAKGEAREKQLVGRDEWWRYMAAKGSKVMRFQNTAESALDIVSKIIDLDNVTLQVQDEMVNQGLNVDQTTAGEALNTELIQQRIEFQKALENLQQEKERARRDHDIQLEEMFGRMEKEKEALLQDLENEHAALHADRREDQRRMEQEFYDERLRLERKLRASMEETVRINDQFERRVSVDRRRLEAEFDGKLYDLSKQQDKQTRQKIQELERRLAEEKSEGQKRLNEALESSERVIRNLKKTIERAKQEDVERHEEDIRNIKKQQGDVAAMCERWMGEQKRINGEILENQMHQQHTGEQQGDKLQKAIRLLEEQKKNNTQTFWASLGSLAGIGSAVVGGIAL